uniref:Reverse transcriptase Ty1/copia-type domain-containing protein n=1 Tax=Fagus sylvatica TaxID=28930 RepID=A0A2N9FDB6_FAGSY
MVSSPTGSLPTHVCQLHKSLYGLKQAPRAWFERFTSHLFTLGFTASVADASLFILSHGSVIVSHLSTAFELKDLDLLHKFNMTDCKAASTPIATTPILSTTRTDILFDPTSYRSLVGALQYATFTRPDITFVVNRMLIGLGTFVIGALLLALLCFLVIIQLPGLQRNNTQFLRSSIEAEYRSLATGAAELAWIRQVLCDLGLYLPSAPLIRCDKTSALALASNLGFHGCTKHIEVDYHFVRERVVRGDLALQFISTDDQLADVFIKALPSTRFHRLCSKLLVCSLRGDDRVYLCLLQVSYYLL